MTGNITTALDEFVKSMQDAVNSIQADMNRLGTLAAAKSAEAKAKYDTEVRPALEKKLKEAEATVAQVKAQGGSAWESMKDSAQSAADGLKAAYDGAVKLFE